MSEWLKEQPWKGCVGLVPTAGSNPALSVLYFKGFEPLKGFGERIPTGRCRIAYCERRKDIRTCRMAQLRCPCWKKGKNQYYIENSQ